MEEGIMRRVKEKKKNKVLLWEEIASVSLFGYLFQHHFPSLLSRGVKTRQMYQLQGMICFQIRQLDACRNLFFDIEINGKNTQCCCITIQ